MAKSEPLPTIPEDLPEATPEPTVEVVRFIEVPGVRLIRADDWVAAGVKDHADTYWDANNGWTVKREDLRLNDEQFARIILADRGFRVESVPVSTVE